jgi:hypothetical protein
MLGVLGAGVGINLAGTYVLLTSERRAAAPVVGGTEAVSKGAEYDAALSSGASSPPPPRNRNAGDSGETPTAIALATNARRARRERLSRDVLARDRNEPIDRAGDGRVV